MQSAQRKDTSGPGMPSAQRPQTLARRRGLAPLTVVLAGLIGVAALGTMLAALLGFWPPRVAQYERTPQATAVAIRTAGLTAEVVGTPARSADQITVTVRVTNQMKVSPRAGGTPTPGANPPTAAPEEAYVRYAGIKVTFYGAETGGGRPIVGAAFGNVTDLPFGESKEIEVVGTGVPEYEEPDVQIDAVWTDKDARYFTPATGSIANQL